MPRNETYIFLSKLIESAANCFSAFSSCFEINPESFIPENLDTSVYDEVITVTENEAYEMARLLARSEGILVGISSGAALSAAVKIAKNKENKGKRIAVILPDTGMRYLSTDLF